MTPTTETLPELRLRLPGEWWQIPLTDREVASRAVKELVRRQFGRVDELAQFRQDLRRQLMSALEKAIDHDGLAMHIALNVVEELPVSATVSVHLPEIAMVPAVGVSATAVIDIAEKGLELTPEVDFATKVRFTAHESEVVRVHRRSLIEKTEDIEDDLPVLLVDYWMSVPGTKRVILLAFATAFAEIEDVMLVFFDSIVRASYWQHPEGESASS